MTGLSVASSIIATLLTGGFITAIIAWRRDKRRAPIERDEAAAAQTMSHVEAADRLMARSLAIAEAADSRSRSIGDKLTLLDAKVAEQGNEIDRLRLALDVARKSVGVLLAEWRKNWPDTPIPALPLDEYKDL